LASKIKGGIKMAEDLDNSIEEYKNKNDELSKSYKRALEILKAKENVENKESEKNGKQKMDKTY
jgi:prefoldin subunit 5